MSRGCMVLTRPSSISGKPVTSSTRVTGMPESLSSFAVPPVEMTVTPMSVRPLANDSTPLLLNTEISARLTFTVTAPSAGLPRAPCLPAPRLALVRKPTRKAALVRNATSGENAAVRGAGGGGEPSGEARRRLELCGLDRAVDAAALRRGR